MPQFIQKLIQKFKRKAPSGVYIAALAGQVVLSHPDGKFTMTPAVARRLANELPALATIAERLEVQA